MQNMRLKVQKNTISLVSYIIKTLRLFRMQKIKLRAILKMYTSIQNHQLKAKITIKVRSLKGYDYAEFISHAWK